jgi:beta-xylosidase
MYKINGKYYLISTDYRPNGRTICSRADNIYGPYEQCTITADETFGYFPVGLTKWKGRIVPDGSAMSIAKTDSNAVAAGNIHQGGIVQTQKGDWYALLMMDFHSVGRTVTLAPVTWTDGWPMVGLPGNLGRAPRTWLKPDIDITAGDKAAEPHAPYWRSEDFDGNGGRNGKPFGRVWQWNHNPDDSKWAVKNGRLRLNTLRGINHEHCSLTCGKRAGNFIGKVNVARSIDQIEQIGFPVQGLILQLHGIQLDRNAALALKFHFIKQLRFHIPFLDRFGQFQNTVRQR